MNTPIIKMNTGIVRKAALLLLALSGCLYAHAQVPVNDDCDGAIELIPQHTNSCLNAISGTGADATMSGTLPSCANSASNDLWYYFTAIDSVCVVNLTNVNALEEVSFGTFSIAAYSGGACGSLTPIDCILETIFPGWPSVASLRLSNLIAGDIYYLQVSGGAAVDTSQNLISSAISFDICANVPVTPVNDECSEAIPITGSGTINGDARGATQSRPPCAFGDAANDVWYSFVPLASGTMTYTLLTPESYVTAEVFSGDCDALSSITCIPYTTGNFPVTAGNTYYLRVFKSYISTVVGDGTFTISLSNVPLPVTGTQLAGSIINNKAQLNWTTFSEHNNRGFGIQRSDDGKNFQNAGWVGCKAPNGNSTQALSYTFSDKEPFSGTVYYRLQQTDIDGKTTFSNILRLATGTENALDIVVSPNPVQDKLVLSTTGTRGNKASISIAPLTGGVVKTVPVTGNETSVDMSTCAPGIYILRYSDDIRNQTFKVIRRNR